MSDNRAAWLAAKHEPLQVGPAPYTEPAEGEILVRNRAVAVNPVDWILPYLAGVAFPWIKPPVILGTDIAGEVAAVGSGVETFKVGHRVLAMAAGTTKSRNRSSEGAFQTYSIVLPRMTTVIPDELSYAQAAVVPLGLTTAACGLFQSDALALEFPTAEATRRGLWVLIWGGATSVGSNAIQLATAAGYDVVTTASPKNFDYVASLGAKHAFDYRSKDVVRDIVQALAGKEVVGAMSIGSGSVPACTDILAQCRGRKFVANVSAPVSFDKIFKGGKPTLFGFLNMMQTMARSNVSTALKSRSTGVTTKFFDASSVVDNEVGPRIYRGYLPGALASGAFRPAPPARVVGSGLEAIQTALDIQRKGVSAEKIVVTLD